MHKVEPRETFLESPFHREYEEVIQKRPLHDISPQWAFTIPVLPSHYWAELDLRHLVHPEYDASGSSFACCSPAALTFAWAGDSHVAKIYARILGILARSGQLYGLRR